MLTFYDNAMNCMSVPMHNPDFFTNNNCLRDIMFFDDVEVDSSASIIKECKYKSVSIYLIYAVTMMTVRL